MILLRANRELKQTFDKLIQTMQVPVSWDGIFAVIDNYIILHGDVRSLFFHFDSKRVLTNLIDIPIKEEMIEETGENVHVCNVINMILYVFGKWGTINGLKVEKNYAQLNRLFQEILREIRVEPEYNQKHFHFYQDGVRVTYEDVVQLALEYEEEKPQAEEEAGGLWHKIVWNRMQTEFVHVETDLKERLKERLGNNFYMVGYLCPSCREKMHMVVYPVGKEFQIETDEGAVLLARAATCGHCNSFYTPRPGKLFSEGDVYVMRFGEDRKAYEDYLELIGKRGERVSNNRFNMYADGRKNTDEQDKTETDEQALEEFCENLPEHSSEEVRRMWERMEEGFYPDENIRRIERKIKAHVAGNTQEKSGANGRVDERKASVQNAGKMPSGKNERTASGNMERTLSGNAERTLSGNTERTLSGNTQPVTGDYIQMQSAGAHEKKRSGEDRNSTEGETKPEISNDVQDAVRRKYEAKLQVCGRFSERQLTEFKEELLREQRLGKEECQNYLKQVEQRLYEARMEQFSKKAAACEGKNYVFIKRVYDELTKDEIPQHVKQPLLERLYSQMEAQGEQEVRTLVAKMPPNLNRAGYRQFMEKLHTYEGVDLKPYEETLLSRQEAAERREVEELVKRARKITKEDYRELLQRLDEGDFLPELLLPYRDKINAKIRQLDADEIAKICLNPLEMTFEEGMEAYQKLTEGDFLPELKEDALKLLSKRLSKIKTDECELLVKKLTEEFKEAGIAENVRHHFYPARKVLLSQALPEETEVIDFAMASYAAGRGLFEYPILVVDTSRNETGKEGMILTPEHLYYSTLLSSYGISITSIDTITASAGLLTRGIYVHQKNGEKIKIPYAVPAKELSAYADVLHEFIRYLQEKPESRKVNYLAEMKHETICCFRCGYAYKGGAICPKCGYQNNE